VPPRIAAGTVVPRGAAAAVPPRVGGAAPVRPRIAAAPAWARLAQGAAFSRARAKCCGALGSRLHRPARPPRFGCETRCSHTCCHTSDIRPQREHASHAADTCCVCCLEESATTVERSRAPSGAADRQNRLFARRMRRQRLHGLSSACGIGLCPSNGAKRCSRSTENGGAQPIATPRLAASCVTGCALQATWGGLGIARGIASGLQSRASLGSSSGVGTLSAVPRCTGGRGTRAAKGVVVQL
jgi:hypothetical protein